MKRNGPLSIAAAALLAAVSAPGPTVCAAQEKSLPAGNPARPPAAGTTEDPAPARRDPAGMVRTSGGKVKIGIDRKDLQVLIDATEVGRMGKIVLAGVENELSLSCPEHAVALPPFWIGKYEVTNAQYQRFLETPAEKGGAKVVHVIPATDQPGARTLEEIARLHLLAEPFSIVGGGKHYPVAVDWKGLYDLNEETVNPVVKGADPKSRSAPELFRDRPLPPGTRITAYRWTVPTTWRAGGSLRAEPPRGRETMPVTGVSLADAMAFAEHFGCHIPTEYEWEGAARGAAGYLWPEGKEFNPLAHAWKGFNFELEKAKPEAARQIAAAKRRLEDAKASGGALERLQAEVDRLQWILDARPLDEDPPYTYVGSFPLGRSPCGALDMVGNVDEWVSTPLFPYPGTDTKSIWRDARARVYRGGNILDKDTLLTATFRKFMNEGTLLGKHFRAATGGFRVARYEAPGASAASHTIARIREIEPPILPRGLDPRTRQGVGPDLDVYGAVGIERYDEVEWTAAGSPGNDPPGKVFHRGRADSLCIVPATGMPFRDPGGIREAAAKAEPPPAGSKRADTREPRDIPFFGLLHLTEGMEVKGEVRTEVKKLVPLTPDELKARQQEREEARRLRDKKAEEEKKEGDGGEKKPPEQKMAGGGDDAKGGKKGGDKEGGKGGDKGGGKEGGAAGGEDGAAPGDAPPEGEEEPEEEDPLDKPIPTHKEVTEQVYQGGFLKGRQFPDGLLLGLVEHDGEVRGALWEARGGNVGSTAPGGTVMLEHPQLHLPKGAVDFKKQGRAGMPYSEFDATSGDVKLIFYVPLEGKGDWFEVTVRLKLGDFPAGTATCPWVTIATQLASPR